MEFYLKLILTSVILTFTFLLYWYYQNFIGVYRKFPSVRIDFKIIYWLLTGKYPRHMPFASFVFQDLCVSLKKHYSEGICLIWLYQPFLFIFSEESVKTFSQEPEAVDKSFMYKVLEDAFGTGLVTSNGDRWKIHRKMFNPAFRLQMLKSYIPIFNKNAIAMIKNLKDAEKEPSVDMEKHMFFCALNIICEVIAGISREENSEMFHELDLIIQKLAKFTTYRLFHPYLRWKFMMKFSRVGRLHLKDLEQKDTIPSKIMMHAKETLTKSEVIKDVEENSDSLMHKTFIHMLLEINMKDPSFTTQDVLDELETFLGAGYDTVALTLVWCIFMLGLHEDVQEKVYNEIKPLANKNVTYDDLIQLTYLDCVIKETMRLYPVVPLHARQLNKDIKCGKYEVPKGTNIVFCPYVYHRNPELYPDPERFDPERFMEGNCNKRPWTHIAFSEGIRNCIGKKFALLEMKVILVHFLNKFKVTALDRIEDVDIEWAVAIKSVRPLRTKLSPRH